MTPEQQQAACREVAEAQGWIAPQLDMADYSVEEYDADRDNNGLNWEEFYSKWWWKSPKGEYIMHGPPDIFATTPDGAAAREEAEAWLLSKWWQTTEVKRFSAASYFVFMSNKSDEVIGNGETLAEARANAVVAAVRASKAVPTFVTEEERDEFLGRGEVDASMPINVLARVAEEGGHL